MSNVHTLEAQSPRFDEDAWDDLLNFIEERRVIPIVGPELLTVETDNEPAIQAYRKAGFELVGEVLESTGRSFYMRKPTS